MTTPPSDQQKQKDIDSILDAALDELDHSDSDDDGDGQPAAAAPLNAPAAPSGVATKPYAKPHYYGPPPPPSLDSASLSAEEAELAASLEGMMQQFMNLNGDFDENDANGLKDAEKAMEEMFRQMMGGPPPAAPSSAAKSNETSKLEKPKRKSVTNGSNNAGNTGSKSPEKTPKKEKDVDETIASLLHNIHHPPNEPDLSTLTDQTISTLLSDINSMSSSQDANPLIDTVMKQLLDKELMYTPMKEVCARFPAYLAKNKPPLGNLTEEQYQNYGKQYQYFQKICRVYETEPDNFERLMELMQDIQDYGQPPVEIVRELAPGLEFDEEGMPIVDPFGGSGGGGALPPFMMGMPGGEEQCCIS